MKDKLKVYHFHNGTGGGVLSVISNLLQHSQNVAIENHVIYTVNKQLFPKYSPDTLSGAVSQQVFYYSPKWNFYYTCKKLAKLLPTDAVIVAHDWLELGMASNLGLQNKVVCFVHGDYDYYYQMAQMNASSVDLYIAIAENIANRLKLMLLANSNKVVYLRFPVPCVKEGNCQYDNNIIFIGRKTIDKGFNLLPKIDELLIKKNILLNWHVVGEGDYIDNESACWINSGRVKFYGKLSNESTLKLIPKMNYYILPSLAEGMPISLIETMKAGVVPFVNDINGGIQELITHNFTGYKVQINNAQAYADFISDVHLNVKQFELIRNNCIKLSNKLFDPIKNSKLIEDTILTISKQPKMKKKSKKIYGSRLDQSWIPNWLTTFIREF